MSDHVWGALARTDRWDERQGTQTCERCGLEWNKSRPYKPHDYRRDADNRPYYTDAYRPVGGTYSHVEPACTGGE